MTSQSRIRSLINRLARIDAAGGWSGSLNPAQYAALDYLARANRHSRAPSHVAEFLGTTRGTMSQTLKALARKGFVQEEPKTGDQRSISYALTAEGMALAEAPSVIGTALSGLEDRVTVALETALTDILRAALDARDGRAFGVCKNCRFHDAGPVHGYCTLLDLPLQHGDRDLICVEHKAPSDDAT
ncbi:MarR family transcriptional regulator (plasmid) [Phaeobacter inhibens]|uniref:MarR family winged helix-turn-helix transcriptional regulator n=1 Tax=Phaeobacter inhibens TaxID=221822 RepID=UPI000971BD21|nr:MarR family transcriptional regulator [Phaeobacter inhibens]APX17949.1 MarR family transcriptional regulator [Phaeobacter inhibens]